MNIAISKKVNFPLVKHSSNYVDKKGAEMHNVNRRFFIKLLYNISCMTVPKNKYFIFYFIQ